MASYVTKMLIAWGIFCIGSLLVIASAIYDIPASIQVFGIATASSATAYIGYIKAQEEAKE